MKREREGEKKYLSHSVLSRAVFLPQSCYSCGFEEGCSAYEGAWMDVEVEVDVDVDVD